MARKSCAKARFLPRMGHGLGHSGVQEMGTSPKVAKGQRKTPLFGRKAVFLWLRGLDLNQRPPGYELLSISPSTAPQCFPGLFGSEKAQNPEVAPLRSTRIFCCLGHGFGSGMSWEPNRCKECFLCRFLTLRATEAEVISRSPEQRKQRLLGAKGILWRPAIHITFTIQRSQRQVK